MTDERLIDGTYIPLSEGTAIEEDVAPEDTLAVEDVSETDDDFITEEETEGEDAAVYEDALADGSELDSDTAEDDETKSKETPSTDYAALAANDLEELQREFPELQAIDHVSKLDNPLRYAALRDLGLTPKEAYLATSKRPRPDGKAHLTLTIPRGAGSPGGGMTTRQLREARELFSDLGDNEIRSLYKKVTG